MLEGGKRLHELSLFSGEENGVLGPQMITLSLSLYIYILYYIIHKNLILLLALN